MDRDTDVVDRDAVSVFTIVLYHGVLMYHS